MLIYRFLVVMIRGFIQHSFNSYHFFLLLFLGLSATLGARNVTTIVSRAASTSRPRATALYMMLLAELPASLCVVKPQTEHENVRPEPLKIQSLQLEHSLLVNGSFIPTIVMLYRAAVICSMLINLPRPRVWA